ncbi:hypothetical protein [Hyalangium rubrum]|uniref:Phospholipase C/D domain-containing protein n=1 Tax=Hyalangium rubrum TaxID=3103134 RepID=A0ABU5HFX0_9BACT|nr:hypothetical protein [Hyalangium sp. s54d21]MDY7231702.1 hypothetical protein [Hyalangium sp. s54d21]
MLARFAAVLLLSLGVPLRAGAFSVGDHQRLTEAAIDSASGSAAHPLLARYRSAVVHGATAEDLNLHVKWTGWHHFYSPEGSLDTAVRRASDSRVRELWGEALEAARHGDMARAFDRAGHLAHHVQDMASPPHVVPVNHGLGDRFERYGVSASLARVSRREVAPLSGDEAQRALARETLAAVRGEFLTVSGGAIPWSAFWSEPETPGPGVFGGYGAKVGNAFGRARVSWNGRMCDVDPAGYAAFMDARISGAVAYTRAFLEWASARFEEAASADTSVALRGFRPAPALSLQFLGGLSQDSRGMAPVLGLRAELPLPHALMLSVDWKRGVGGSEASLRPGGWALAVLSPPLWTARPGYPLGLDLRAAVGVGLVSWEGQRRVGVPLGLRLHAAPGSALTLSTELLYQGMKPPDAAWRHGVAFTLGVGLAWGDR